MSKGASQLVTMALYVGITVSAVSGAVTVGGPALENLQEAASIRQAQNFMQTVDSNVQNVVSEGEDSTRTMDLVFDRGKIYFDDERNVLVYELRTGAEVISSQTSSRQGNIITSSSADVSVFPAEVNSTGEYEVAKDQANCYMMKNDIVKACIKKVDQGQDLNTSDLLMHYEYIEDDQSKELDANLTVKLNGVESSSHGTGKTEMVEQGNYLGTGEIRATVNSDFGYTYEVLYQLPTGSDFLKVDVQNFR